MNPIESTPTIFGLPLNRVVAFFGPQVSVGAGIVATWLTSHVHLLATFHVGQSSLAQSISQAVVFGVTTAVTWAGAHKWLDGFQKWAYSTVTHIGDTDLPWVPDANVVDQPPEG